MLAHANIPFKGRSEIRESRKLRSEPLLYYFSLGAPDVLDNKQTWIKLSENVWVVGVFV